MCRSRIGWAVGVIAPWCLGLGLVVSFTAIAGQDASIGASIALPSFRTVPAPADLVPSIASLRDAFGLSRPHPGRIQLASLTLGDKADLLLNPDEIEPRNDIKVGAHEFPQIDRSRRGDPIIGLRPTLDTRLRKQGGLEGARAAELILSTRGSLAFEGFAPATGPAPGPDSVASFEPVGESAPVDTGTSSGAASSATTGATLRPALRAGLSSRAAVFDGATPSVPRAMALGSATPAPADMPVNATALLAPRVPQKAAPLESPVQASIVARAQRPDYAALVDQDHRSREEYCLAQAVYFEARSEPEAGQAAVAQVVLNRVSSGLYPPSICGVVFQNRHRYKACQFSFTCEGRALRITEPGPWASARRIARDVLAGTTYLEPVGGATHYHATYVRPGWSRRLKRTDKIGQHIFYKLRPGQT